MLVTFYEILKYRALQTGTGESKKDLNRQNEMEVLEANIDILLNNLDMESFLRMKQNPEARKKKDIYRKNEGKCTIIYIIDKEKDNLGKNIYHTPNRGWIPSVYQALLQTTEGQITEKNMHGQLKKKIQKAKQKFKNNFKNASQNNNIWLFTCQSHKALKNLNILDIGKLVQSLGKAI